MNGTITVEPKGKIKMQVSSIRRYSVSAVVIVAGTIVLTQFSPRPLGNIIQVTITPTPPITPISAPPEYPTMEVQIPQGIPAIQPTKTDTIPAFTNEDVQQFVTTHAMPLDIVGNVPAAVVRIDCSLESKNVSELLEGATTGLPDDLPVCYVELQGNFVFGAPPSEQQPEGGTITFESGFEVFASKTGNMLLSGGLP